MKKKDVEDLFVVGIGASAGGLEAIQQLFDKVPEHTGMAFIVIQHLSPDFKSLMPELLAKHTKMKIFTAEDKLTIKPNCIYLNQRNKNLHIKGSQLFLLDKGPKHNLNLPIDIFFHTLGEEYKDKSIGIILSGTGSDGSRGIKTIKEAGGTIIVQEPSTAQFDGMPNSSISTGLVDMVLPPEKIAEALFKFPNKRLELVSDDIDSKSGESVFNKILEEIYKSTKIDFSLYKKNTLIRRLEKRMNINNIDSLFDYLNFIRSKPHEKEILKQDFLIGVTSFFRDIEAFDSLKNSVIPAICLHKNNTEPIRIWVSGCSTGEEVYSIAILLDEYLRFNKFNFDFKIFATDIDNKALNTAGLGSYHINIGNEIDKKYLENYFLKTGDKIQIIKRIREKIVFSFHNILKDPPFIRMDLITCRNMLIYFENKAQARVMHNFQFSLNKFGYLFLGNSESLGVVTDLFKTIDVKWKIYQNISDAKHIPSQDNPENRIGTFSYKSTDRQILHPEYRFKESPDTVFHKYLSKKHSPASIFVDNNFNILFIKGDAGKRLSHSEGVFQNNLLKMVTPEIAAVIRNGIRRLDAEKMDIIIKDIVNKTENELFTFDLSFHKPDDHDHLRNVYLVQFGEEKEIEYETTVVEHFPFDEISKQRFDDLENELKETKTELQNVVEELETSNEELQSSNEELMASNEELQSTNEELQSVNEELYTVNSEMQEKNKELQNINNDISNLLNSTDIGTLFLDLNLRIRKFTPALQRHFKLQDSDLGRSISDFASNFDEATKISIIENSKASLEKLALIEKEIRDEEGNYFLAKIRPFITLDKKIDGVVISFIDVNSLKKAKSDLKETDAKLAIALEAGNMAWWEMKLPSGAVAFNKNKAEMIGRDPKDFKHYEDFMAFVHPDDKDNTMKSMQNHLEGISDSYDCQYRIRNIDGNYQWYQDIGKIVYKDNKETIISGIVIEITDKKQTEIKLVEAMKKAEAANIHKNYFLANMSHEIRTPMNAVIGFSGLLKEPSLAVNEREKYVDIIDRNAMQLLNLIDDIIDVAKIEAEEINIEINKCKVAEILTDLEDNFNQIKTTYLSKNIKFKAEIPLQYQNIEIKTDCLRIRQVLSNLLNNALKFTDEGNIIFGFDVKRDKIEFYVKDSGIGIPPEKTDEIFERFKQVHYENAAVYGGTGLGLAICKGIIELLGGHISVKSVLGRGTTFLFDLPINDVKAKTKNLKGISNNSEHSQFENMKILIVDDDTTVQFFFNEVFKQYNPQIFTAENGRKAVEIYQMNQDIEIILMDIRMPVMDGFKAIDAILKINPKAKIIAQTSFAMKEERKMCMDAGCVEYITKPIIKSELFDAIEKLV